MTRHDANPEASWLFCSDLHGDLERYGKLFDEIHGRRPGAALIGRDLLPSSAIQMTSNDPRHEEFVEGFLAARFEDLREELDADYPEVLLILGNDDPRAEEAAFLEVARRGLWQVIHKRRVQVGAVPVYGYAHVPPTPFQLKDWERYDVSRFVDPGCVPPTRGYRTVPVPEHEIEWATIQADLAQLAGDDDLSRAVFLFHSPPYQTELDRAALDGMKVDHAPLDVHVGSIAMKRFIRARRPRLTLHGHVHESARLTGSWIDRIGDTVCISAAHDGPELALVQVDPEHPEGAERILC